MKLFLFLIVAVLATAQAISFFELVNQEWTTFKVIKYIAFMKKVNNAVIILIYLV